jgi:hypothetical protein
MKMGVIWTHALDQDGWFGYNDESRRIKCDTLWKFINTSKGVNIIYMGHIWCISDLLITYFEMCWVEFTHCFINQHQICIHLVAFAQSYHTPYWLVVEDTKIMCGINSGTHLVQPREILNCKRALGVWHPTLAYEPDTWEFDFLLELSCTFHAFVKLRYSYYGFPMRQCDPISPNELRRKFLLFLTDCKWCIVLAF